MAGSRLVSSVDNWFPDVSYAGVVHTGELVVLLRVCAFALANIRATTAPWAERGAFAALVLGALSVDIGEGIWLTLHDFRMFADLYALAILVLRPPELRPPTRERAARAGRAPRTRRR